MSDNRIRPKLISEFIGTFFLALTICTAAVHGSAGQLAPFAIASTLMVMIYSVGHISGAHFNPAVTIAIWLRGACDKDEVSQHHQILQEHCMIISENILFADTSVTALQMETTHAIGAEFLHLCFSHVILNVVLVR